MSANVLPADALPEAGLLPPLLLGPIRLHLPPDVLSGYRTLADHGLVTCDPLGARPIPNAEARRITITPAGVAYAERFRGTFRYRVVGPDDTAPREVDCWRNHPPSVVDASPRC